MATDRELVNFSQEHELNTVLARHGKAQSKANREMLNMLENRFAPYYIVGMKFE